MAPAARSAPAAVARSTTCPATLPASSSFPAPVYWATKATPAMVTPMPREKVSQTVGNVMATAATSSVPTRETEYMSARL